MSWRTARWTASSGTTARRRAVPDGPLRRMRTRDADGRRRAAAPTCSASNWRAPAGNTTLRRARSSKRQPATTARPGCVNCSGIRRSYIRPKCSAAQRFIHGARPMRTQMVSNWARQDFPAIAPACVFRCSSASPSTRGCGSPTAGAGRDRVAVRRRAPVPGQRATRGRTQHQPRPHRRGLPLDGSFVRRRMRERSNARQQPMWRPVDARRIHRTGQPGRPDGADGSSKPVSRRRCGHAGRPHSSRIADTAAKIAGSPAELAAASDLVCLCVVGDADVEEVAARRERSAGRAQPGGVIAIHSTVHPKTCQGSGRKGCRARCFGDRCTSERRRARGRRSAVCW